MHIFGSPPWLGAPRSDTNMKRHLAFAALVIAGALGCGGHAAPVPEPEAGFAVVGDPESRQGARWTFRGTRDGTFYDLSGVLLKPPGEVPFPAVILSHGSRGNANFIASLMGPTMVGWGLVCIAVNYTHSEGVPIGAPGDSREPGASRDNMLRLQMTYELLRDLKYVDMSRIALHGHSMGAWLSIAAAGEWPNVFRVASTTGGGIRPVNVRFGPAPSPSQARGIRIPFQMHHGGDDETVPVGYDQRFDALLAERGVEHQLFIYPGKGHLQVRSDPVVMTRIHDWYAAHGML